MEGLIWAAGTWALLILLWAWRDGRAGRQRSWLNRENIALLFAMLGALSIAQTTTAEDLIRDPVVIERMIRGVLATVALLIAGPVLVDRLRRGPPIHGYATLTAITVYLSVAAISILYSAARIVTAAKFFEVAAAFVAIGAAAMALDGRNRLRTMITFMMALLAALLASSVVGFFAFPEFFAFRAPYRPGFTFELTMQAPSASSNELSAIGAIFGTYALARALDVTSEKRATWLAGFALGAIGVLLASGRQGILMLAIGVFVLLWFRRRALFVTLIAPAIVILSWMNWEFLFRTFSRGQPQLLSNLTGRLPWWQAALASWAEHPWTGYGYGAGGRFVGLASIGRSSVSNVHSGYIEALVGVGLLGVIPLLIAVGLVVSWSLGALRDGRDVPFAILIVPLVIHTFIDLGFGGWLKPDLILLVCLGGLADWWRGKKLSTPRLEGLGAAGD